MGLTKTLQHLAHKLRTKCMNCGTRQAAPSRLFCSNQCEQGFVVLAGSPNQ